MDSYFLIGTTILATVGIVSLLSWQLIGSRGHWVAKVSSILIVVGLSFGTMYVWRSLQGSPKIDFPLNGMVVKSYIVVEPKMGSKGNIWLWLTYPIGGKEPISVEIPYSKQMQEKLMTNKELKRGRPQQFKRKSDNKNNPRFDNDTDDLELRDPPNLKNLTKDPVQV